jgi:hypothetical protein
VVALTAVDGGGGGRLSLCVYLLGGALLATLPGEVFELRWTHSVARTEWREVWRVAPDGALILEEARINGTGAGMEPGEGAWSADGRQVWKPDGPPLPEVTLAASDFTAEHVLCAGEDCRVLSAWTGGIRDAAVTLKGCGRAPL